MERDLYPRSYVRIEATYPHPLLLRLKRLVEGNIDAMRDSEDFVRKYGDRYKDRSETDLLQLAYDKGIVKGFFDCMQEAEWRKRTWVETSVNILVDFVSEKSAVMLIESLMFVFGFPFSLDVERKWDSPEPDRANFHEKTEFDRTKQYPVGGLAQNAPEAARRDESKKSSLSKKTVQKERTTEPASSKGRLEAPIPWKEGADVSQADKGRLEAEKRGADQPEEDSAGDGADGQQDILKGDISSAKFFHLMNSREIRTLKKARMGNAVSQCEIGDYYSEDNSGHFDYGEAVKWYSLSAKNGYERAFFEMGKLYDQNSQEIPNAKEKAFQIYMAMAKKGFPTAQCILGMKYRFGDGVKADTGQAVFWLEKAALQGHENAIANLADLYLSLHEEKKAGKWYQIGASLGNRYCRERCVGIGRMR